MRGTRTRLSDAPDAPALSAVLDEGAEVSCIMRDALRKAGVTALQGYSAFAERADVEKLQLYIAQNGVPMRSFHGADAQCQLAATLHGKLGQAWYPITFLVVPSVPAELVIGLSALKRYKKPVPRGLRVSRSYDPLWGNSRICLGVPRRFAEKVPRSLAHVSTDPNDNVLRKWSHSTPSGGRGRFSCKSVPPRRWTRP